MNNQLDPTFRTILNRWSDGTSASAKPSPESPKPMPEDKTCVHSWVIRDGLWKCLHCNSAMPETK